MVKWIVGVVLAVLPISAFAADTVSVREIAPVDPQAENEHFGWTVAGGGDVNNDGYEDFLVGAPDAGEDGEGRMYLFYGRAGKVSLLDTSTAITFSGEADSDHFGAVVAWLGDINNDGYDDFAGTSRYHDTNLQNPGTVYIFYGKANTYSNQTVEHRTRFYGTGTRDAAGTAVAGVGDMNNDGYDDFVITSPDNHSANKGAIYLVYGQAAAFSETEDLDDYVSFTGETNYDYLGSALASGDINSDGYSDFAVSSIRYDNNGKDAGKVYVVPGKASKYTDTTISAYGAVVGTTRSELIGSSLAIANVVGDTHLDIVIGARENDTGASQGGAVYVYPGTGSIPSNASITEAVAITNPVEGSLTGYSVASLGDVNADSYDDILVGSPSELDPETGKAFVIMGGASVTNHSITSDFTVTGEEQASELGDSVSTTDFDGDGVRDLLMAAPYYGADAGRVYLGYWPIHTCSNSAEVGGILADYPTSDWKYRKYAENKQYKIVVERKGKLAKVVNCYTDTVVQTLTFNTRAQRKILARVFTGRQDHLFIAATRTYSKRKLKIFLYQLTPTQLEQSDYVARRWRPRGLRLKLGKKNVVTVQRGKEKKHRIHYRLEPDFTLTAL